MLDIKKIRENPDLIKENLKKRIDFDLSIVDKVLEVDSKWREIKRELDSLKSIKNKESLNISKIKKEGGDIKAQIQKVKEISNKIEEKEKDLNELEGKRNEILMRIPNLLDDSVPIGKDDEDNVEIITFGEKPKFDFKIRNHQELCELNNWYDLETASKVSGARFYYLKNELLMLEIALYQFVLNKLISKGYSPVEVPPMLRREILSKSVSLEDFEEVIYKIEDEDLYLIGTSEHALAALGLNKTYNYKELPIKLAGLSPCYRKEAGVTKDEKGIFRVHNFNKIEQFIFSKPEESEKFLEELISNAEEIFQDLEIHYRIVNICSGDIGNFAAKKYDLEAFLPGQDKYREMVSASNYKDYGARRLNCRFQTENGDLELVHTLNSTAIALTRTLIAIIETHQTGDGNVRIPKILRPYFGGREFLVQK
jgi:seryl-tRNA synthetase